ncbi:Cysteine protease StiP precursor [Pseudovibrio sp. W64]|uniref:cysteine protease StiP domain-containing protein n=1 Tax=Pseudovibrio sp. W64 TaxID=1735583 RepID=UPI0007B235A6|nr:cysteine protease StiP domain-containing protein [Pseudovibrio sp. W64]KZK79076.1 Cysteine protease StiP precursor [Pseudovibrio sp. W64]
MLDNAILSSGTYDPSDVLFLLKQVAIEPTPVDEKERLIQTGAAHYSEMISQERRPDERYLEFFEQARSRGDIRISREIAGLAKAIKMRIAKGELDAQITLCSLVRAGVPYGVLLHRELKATGVDCQHFGISIIRDKGLDTNAMRYITSRRNIDGILFVDGWTGKGAISRELETSWKAFAGSNPELVVLADPSGFATMSGSHEDWLIPSGILGANISGLISRSILSGDLIAPDDFHGYIPVNHLADIDVSRAFVDRISSLCETERKNCGAITNDAATLNHLRQNTMRCVHLVAELNQVDNLNRIKPGISEATRAILRRKPKKVYIRSKEDEDLCALIHLCQTGQVPLEVSPTLTGPFRAITLIEKMS